MTGIIKRITWVTAICLGVIASILAVITLAWPLLWILTGKDLMALIGRGLMDLAEKLGMD
jgi:preprotein translocase subunit SecY